MKFAHLADIHLGYEQYNQSWRADDFARAFRLAAEKIIAENVDFVIIAGDLFHRSVPNPKTIKEAIEILSIFKKARIPVFAVEGNHDKSVRDISAYHLLESLGLLNVLGLRKKRVEGEFVTSERIENVYLVKGVVGNIEILGDRHRTKWQLEKVLPLLKSESDESILVLHQAVKEVVDVNLDMAFDVTLSDLPKANYYAMGHVHTQTSYEFNGRYVAYPGSLERYDLREASRFVTYSDEMAMRDGIDKGFFIVEDFIPRAVKIDVRDLISLSVEAERRSEAERKFLEALKVVGSEAILVAKLTCREDVDIKRLSDIAAKHARYAEIRFERIRDSVERIALTPEHEFFSEFEIKLLELLRDDSEIYRNAAYDFIKEQFGLAEVRRLSDFEQAEKTEKVESAKQEKKPKKPRTLLDFFG